MSEAERGIPPSSLWPALVMGLLSGLLYGTVVLSLAFLLPVQIAFGRQGRKHGLVAGLVAFAIALAFQVVELAQAGGVAALRQDAGLTLFLALAALPPALLLGGLALMNAPFWNSRNGAYRGFAGAAPAVLLSIPGLVALVGNGAFREKSAAMLQGLLDSFLANAAKGTDTEALRASFDIPAIARVSETVLVSAFAGFLLVLVAGSWWVGSRLSGRGSLGRSVAPAMADYHLPYPLVWAFLASWTGVLASLWLKAGQPYSALAWNLALVVTLAYAAQGLGIVSHFMRRVPMPGMTRILIVVTGVMLVMTPPVGAVFLGLLPVLGVTEVWIPYRNPKGVGA